MPNTTYTEMGFLPKKKRTKAANHIFNLCFLLLLFRFINKMLFIYRKTEPCCLEQPLSLGWGCVKF